MTEARRRKGDNQDGGGAGTPCNDAHARSDDISGDSCGLDQVRRERWKRGAPTAACGAQAEVGGSVTSSRGRRDARHPRWSRRTRCGSARSSGDT